MFVLNSIIDHSWELCTSCASIHVPKLVQTNINLEVMNSSVLIEFNKQTHGY